MPRTSPIRTAALAISLAVLVGAIVVPIASTRRAKAASNGPRTLVLVELFTSEGCSDCPPADALLSGLSRRQPVDGAQVIALEFHVDYWNDQGWNDRFSSHQFTERQESYDRAMGHITYTPEMIVDGRRSFVGSDASEARSTIRSATGDLKKATVRITRDGDHLAVTVDGADAGATVYLAVAQDGLSTEVKAGENDGRSLRHDAVVRRLLPLGTTAQNPWSANWAEPNDFCSAAADSSLVVFVQKRGMGAIEGVAATPLSSLCSH